MNQGDISMYSKENIEKRKKIRHHPDMERVCLRRLRQLMLWKMNLNLMMS